MRRTLRDRQPTSVRKESGRASGLRSTARFRRTCSSREWRGRSCKHFEQLAQVANRRVRDDFQTVLERRRDRGAADGRIEMHGGDAEALRAVDIDVEVVAD